MTTENVEEVNDHSRRMLLELSEHLCGLINEQYDTLGDNEAVSSHRVGQEELD